jgi:hypothetical protein
MNAYVHEFSYCKIVQIQGHHPHEAAGACPDCPDPIELDLYQDGSGGAQRIRDNMGSREERKSCKFTQAARVLDHDP